MSLSFHHPEDVLRFACDIAQSGEPYAVVVAANVTGGTMRATGALMCIPEKGAVAGYISNGCVDADIIYQARAVTHDGHARHVIYGEGSPFKDISLPCGGRIELWIIPNLSFESMSDCVTRLAARNSASLDFGIKGVTHTYTPKLRLRIAGKGEAVKALASQAIESGFDVTVQSPEPEIADGLDVTRFDHLSNPADLPVAEDDPWTAVILLFHDHDWEPDILTAALNGPAFYIGAMGSERTHQARCETLRARGIPQDQIDRLVGPIGLIPSMRDANLLALSTLGEIVKVAQEKGCL